MDSIPVANIYYLLCYAWDQFAPDVLNKIATESSSDILHLFTRMLAAGVRVLHKRGFETGYTDREETISSVRGRIVITRSIQIRRRHPGRLVCLHDELDTNILRNKILKSTLLRIVSEPSLEKAVRAEARDALGLLNGFEAIELNDRTFYQAQGRQPNRLYVFLMNVCEFFFKSLQPTETENVARFQSVLREPERMRRIFEKFVRNFLARRQQLFAEVRAEEMNWSAIPIGDSDIRFLPAMLTDVTLRSPTKTAVIECKFTPSLFQRARYSSEKFRSSHLYQLCTYLRALEQNDGPDAAAEGILLYPAASVKLDQRFFVQGHLIRVKTIDLDRDFSASLHEKG
jgi:5-methylcytosine-specific restriction enzyme subunit McrC